MNPEENQDRAFRERVLRYQEKRLSAEELRELNQELRDNPERQAEFAEICETSRLIREASRGLPIRKARRSPRVRSFPARRNWINHVGIAAILMLLLGLFWLLGSERGSKRGSDWGDAVARVEMISSDASIAVVDGAVIKEGALLGKSWLQVDEGSLRLKFRSGALVTLEAPASFAIDSAMRSYLEFGKVDVFAPESAREFVVATNAMEVVDLGTRFGLKVDFDSGESVVEVTEGLVDLHLGSRGTQRQIQPLEAGWKAEVDGTGNILTMEARPRVMRRGQEALLARWQLDEISPGGETTDSGPGGIDGILRGETAGTTVPGRVGNALDMGDQGYLDLSQHVDTLSGLGSFTLTAWIRDPGDNVSILFSFSDGSASNRIQFNLNRRFLVYLWQDQSSHWDSVAGPVDGWKPGQWYHVAVSVSPSGVRLYRDGDLLATGSKGVQIGTPILTPPALEKPKEVFLGHVREGTAQTMVEPQWFGGVMDDVQLYAGALDHAAIRYLCEKPGEALPRPVDEP